MEVSEWTAAVCSGAVAGLVVDVTMFPIDTIKTRLQSKAGLMKSGGFRNLYAGIGPVFFGSAPGAAVFFTTYEFAKSQVGMHENNVYSSKFISSMFAASLGEVAACVVRVPAELIKQRTQVGGGQGPIKIVLQVIKNNGPAGLYQGYRSTVLREIPFSLIQFPIWEILKDFTARFSNISTSVQSAVCGFCAGAIAAGLTTPLDVAKTRIMLAADGELAARGKICPVLLQIYRNEGIKSLFLGVKPRVAYISIGGFVFLGSYDFVKSFMIDKHNPY